MTKSTLIFKGLEDHGNRGVLRVPGSLYLVISLAGEMLAAGSTLKALQLAFSRYLEEEAPDHEA